MAFVVHRIPEQSENRGVCEEVFHTIAEVSQDDQHSKGGDRDECNGVRDGPWDDDESWAYIALG